MAAAGAEAGPAVDRRVLVQGVHVPLHTPLVWLFEACSYPDGFLYVCCKVSGQCPLSKSSVEIR
jgi:autophagy-related protein 5